MIRRRCGGACASLIVLILLVSCGSPANPTAGATNTPAIRSTPSQTPAPTPSPTTTADATVSELTAIAALVYPNCTPANCVGGAMFTTCDASSSGADVFASCPLTARLIAQLRQDVQGVPSAPDPIGGGQDPEWTTRTVTATPSATGGIAQVVLGFGPGTAPEKYDLVVIVQASQLLVDDLYCTGADASANDVFAPGWITRSVCTT